MAIYKGNKKVVAVYKGSTPINKIYKGSTLVFQKSGGGGSTHLFEGTATGNFDLKINNNPISITPDADGKWFYDTDEKITDLTSLFSPAAAVTSVDLSNLDLTGITANSMLSWCTKITSIKFNNTKSMKPRELNFMFNNCRSLTSLDLSSFNPSNLQRADNLFSACTSLETLDLSNFDISNTTTYSNMFADCPSLSTIKCKQAFKDWCVSNYTQINLTNYSTINWEIVD